MSDSCWRYRLHFPAHRATEQWIQSSNSHLLLARYTLFLTLLLFWVQISAWKIPHSKGSLVLNWKGGQSCSLITLKVPWKRDWSLLASSTQEPAAGNFSRFCSEWSSSALMYWSESFSLSFSSSPLLIYKTSDEIETHSRKHQRFQTSEPYLSLCTLISIFFPEKALNICKTLPRKQA